MIREVTTDDIEAIINLSAEFFSEVDLAGAGLSLDRDTMEFFVIDGMADPDMNCFLLEENGEPVGFIAGMVRPWMFNAEISVLTELVWYVRKSAREANPMGAFMLLKALKKWGKARGATVLHISSTAREESPRVLEFYRRQGLIPLDNNFIGGL